MCVNMDVHMYMGLEMKMHMDMCMDMAVEMVMDVELKKKRAYVVDDKAPYQCFKSDTSSVAQNIFQC